MKYNCTVLGSDRRSVRIFRWLQFLKLGGHTAIQQNFHRERGAPAATGGGIPQWRHAWGREPQSPPPNFLR